MKIFIVVIVFLTVILAGCWFVAGLRAKAKYDLARQQTSIAYQVTSFDRQSIALLNEVQGGWLSKSDVTNGPDAAVVKLAGMTPSVTNLINVFNYQMPQYSWFSSAQNKRSAAHGLIKAQFMPISIDKRWYLAQDGHLAMLHCKTNIVYVYRDQADGLRATMYVKKKGEARK